MALFDILSYSFSSIIWGILIAVVCLVLFVFLIKGWYKDATFSPMSYIVGAVLFFLLSFQCILIVGSLKILDSTDEYERVITNFVDNYYDNDELVSTEQASEIIQVVINEYPILQYYIGGGVFYGFTAKELPEAITDELRSFMLWYILRRVFWCLVFVVVSAICVIKTMSRKHKKVASRQTVYIGRRLQRRTKRY